MSVADGRTKTRAAPWLRQRLSAGASCAATRAILRQGGLHTVCEEARCPNRNRCFSAGTATFLILGDRCTRRCGFCATRKAEAPLPASDPEEPGRLATTAAALGLRHVVVTSVTRDDLGDGGAAQFRDTVRALRLALPACRVEVLTPDFGGDDAAIETVVAAGPDVYNHNLETVAGLYPTVRPQADYQRSLRLLARVKDLAPGIWTKSGIMVGLGEDDDAIRGLFDDLVAHRVQILTIGQYLQGDPGLLPVSRFVEPDAFERYRAWGLAAGLRQVFAGPWVRSSFAAAEVLDDTIAAVVTKDRPAG